MQNRRIGRSWIDEDVYPARESDPGRRLEPQSETRPRVDVENDRLRSYGAGHEPVPSSRNYAYGAVRRKKILIVDDSLTSMMMHRAILSKRSYDIVTARDGREAIDKALQERPDLIIMDVVMPHMDGFQACTRLRSMATTKSVPILLVTTRNEAESVANGFASGCTAYIAKPVNSVELLAKVKNYLGE